MRFVVTVIAGLLASVGLPAPTAPLAAPTAARKDLSSLARSILGEGQGVYIESADGTVLLAQAAATPVHPASVSKVPTTLALLRKLGPEYRFSTTFSSSGRIVDGTLYGDLLDECGADPSLVDEDALLIAERLKQSGLHAIAGELHARGTLTFNWHNDDDATLLHRALTGQTPPAAWEAVREVEIANGVAPGSDALAQPGIRFANNMQPVSDSGNGAHVTQLRNDQPLAVYRSQPLLSLVKSLNEWR